MGHIFLFLVWLAIFPEVLACDYLNEFTLKISFFHSCLWCYCWLAVYWFSSSCVSIYSKSLELFLFNSSDFPTLHHMILALIRKHIFLGLHYFYNCLTHSRMLLPSFPSLGILICSVCFAFPLYFLKNIYLHNFIASSCFSWRITCGKGHSLEEFLKSVFLSLNRARALWRSYLFQIQYILRWGSEKMQKVFLMLPPKLHFLGQQMMHFRKLFPTDLRRYCVYKPPLNPPFSMVCLKQWSNWSLAQTG